MIRLERLSKSYTEGTVRRPVLVGASGEVRAGEWVALLGPSGSGKTTLLNLIGGLDLPDEGVVTVGDRCVSALPERERSLYRRTEIGFIFQFLNLLPTLTVRENLLLPTELAGLDPAEAQNRSSRLLARVGLADRAASFPDVLSGGERQRVAIARALVHEPPIILADEPTGNLDARTGGEVLDLMEELLRESGATLIIVTHSERVAARADRVLVLEGGVLLEREGHARAP